MKVLTKQERKFVKIKAKTGNGTRAVQEAFDIKDPDYASVKAVRLLGNDRIVKAIADELPDELLLEVHLEGLAATREGEPDYATRHKYLDSGYKLKGTYAPEKSVNLNVEAKLSKSDPIIEKARNDFDEVYRQRLIEDMKERGA